MAELHETGKKAEAIAGKYLINQGYQILETNWQSNHQEVDIIARNDDVLIIVEVKSRRSNYFGNPEASVTRHKQNMLIKAANHYIALHQLNLEVRFDIIAVLFHDKEHALKHIKNAFYPTIS
jgi:putative endonuclease